VDRQRLGRLGEELAAAWYVAHGYTVLARRWRCRAGELDLVVRRGGLLACVEVKCRRGRPAAPPAAAVDRRKRRHLRAALLAYLHREAPRGVDLLRGDVVGVVVDPDGLGCRLTVLPGVLGG